MLSEIFNKLKSNQAEKYLLEFVNKNPDEKKVFSGDIYSDKSKIKSSNTKKDQIFIIGYGIKLGNLFYEIWYNPHIGVYVIYDRFGKQINKQRNKLKDIAAVLMVLVRKENDIVADKETDIVASGKSSIKKMGYDVFDFDDDNITRVGYDEYSKVMDNIVTIDTLKTMINAKIKEYNTSRLSKTSKNSLWKRLIGNVVEVPSDLLYRGGFKKLRQKIDRLLGKEKEAIFVKGYTFNDKVNTEIWYVKDGKTEESKFYVFDLSSGKPLLLSDEAKTLSKAARVIADKIKIPDPKPETKTKKNRRFL